MFTKVLEYVDFNGNQVKEEFRFNLTKAEILEMQLEKSGGFAESIQRVIDSKDTPSIIKIFKDLLIKSYGIKSEDGKRFIKNDKIREEFTQTAAYSELFVEFASNADSASAFVNGIMPPADQVQVIKDK